MVDRQMMLYVYMRTYEWTDVCVPKEVSHLHVHLNACHISTNNIL